jgi:hypothetical protein
MKKTFTLLFALGLFAIVQAQPGNRDNRDTRQPDQRDYTSQNDRTDGYDSRTAGYETDFNRGFRYDDRFSMERNISMQIERINRVYDYKIQSVKRDFFMSWWEKKRQIRFLEDQRQWEIRRLFDKCRENNRRYNDHDHRDHDRRY